MFIHIGGNNIVRTKDVVVILDINHLQRNPKKKDNFLKKLIKEKENVVIKIAEDEVKSLIITTNYLYYSPISSLTLKKRAESSI